jgi:glycine dehydrogenase subunit 1
MDYVPLDNNHIQEMLKTIGVSSIEELYSDVPKKLLISQLDLPKGLSEPDVLTRLNQLTKKNGQYLASFLGAGCYYHYIPTVVDFVLSRSEFYTAYTPYQAEASQGFLQAIYEYQTAISRLTGMEVANASMYDGASALAEAAMMAITHNRTDQILVVEGIHPQYLEVLKTYCWGRKITIIEASLSDLESKLTEKIGGVLFQNPTFFGDLFDCRDMVKLIRMKSPKTLIIQAITDPSCLGVIRSPGENDIDILVAEGQALGIPPSFGGPGLGIFATKNALVRKMPGRLIGKTKEVNGEKEGFVLTLQAREQHIRRDKALSNICSNQALCMLSTLVYLSSMGKDGLYQIASQNFRKAAYLKEQISKIAGFKVLNTGLIYNEFVIESSNINAFCDALKKAGYLPPLKLGKFYPERKNQMLICVTELVKKDAINAFIDIAKKIGGK